MIINRNTLFRHFRQEHEKLPARDAISIFKSITNQELAEIYGLKVLRKGYFTHLK